MVRARLADSTWAISGTTPTIAGAGPPAALVRISARYAPNSGQATSSQYVRGTSRRMVHSKLDTFILRWSLLGGRAPGAVLMPGLVGSPKTCPSNRESIRAASQNQCPAFFNVLTGDG